MFILKILFALFSLWLLSLIFNESFEAVILFKPGEKSTPWSNINIVLSKYSKPLTQMKTKTLVAHPVPFYPLLPYREASNAE